MKKASTQARHVYAIGIGSNRALSRVLGPADLVRAAIAALSERDLVVVTLSPILRSRPMGPSARDYANAAAIIETPLPPPALLAALQTMEARFRRRRRRRWGARTLDLDIILWSGGRWQSRALTIPHPAFRNRPFVIAPLRAIAPRWRDPVSGLTMTHLAARLQRAKPVDPGDDGR